MIVTDRYVELEPGGHRRMARLSIGHLRKTYGDLTVVDDVNLDISDGEFLVLLGPSGCGKTTTLRMVAGFVPPSAGKLVIGERDVTGLPPWKRNCGLVFQTTPSSRI